jgi:hypothetical protein
MVPRKENTAMDARVGRLSLVAILLVACTPPK